MNLLEGFKSEYELVTCCNKLIHKSINKLRINVTTLSEVKAPGGIPDLLIFSQYGQSLDYLVAVEFKLSNWKRALRQAFRYRNFGNESYVVLDRKRANVAIDNLEIFIRANIGLVTIDVNKKVQMWHLPEPQLPFSPQYSIKVAHSLLPSSKLPLDDQPFIRTIKGKSIFQKLKTTLRA